MGTFDNGASLEADVYVQRLATYIRRNEEALANGLLCFSKARPGANIKPLRLSFTTHHLYYMSERINGMDFDVDVGPLNVKLDSPNHEPTFISFMANNARSQHTFESDARSVSSMNSMKSIVSSASAYWTTFQFTKDPKSIQTDVKYLYSSFTKIPCLILSPRTKVHSVAGYEEYPCDTSVPLKMFKNLQVLELVEYEPNEVYGWHSLSERLRILIVRNTKLSSLEEVLYTLVMDDEHGRTSFNIRPKKFGDSMHPHLDPYTQEFSISGNRKAKNEQRKRAMTASPLVTVFMKDQFSTEGSEQAVTFTKSSLSTSAKPSAPLGMSAENYEPAPLSANKWLHMKQLTVTESSITQIPGYVFRPLLNLVKLNLSNNLLEDLPSGLEHLPNLKYLNLADNYITTLKKVPKNMNQLVSVNFNNNKIEHLSGIENLTALEKVDLRRNKLKDLTSLLPLVRQVSTPGSRLNNVFVSNNNLHRTYRLDLFNLFSAAKPKNIIKIDDSCPGYFERAMLLDPDSAKKFYEKVMGDSDAAAKVAEKNVDLETINANPTSLDTLQRKNVLNLNLTPTTPEKHKKGHKHSRSAGDILENLTSLDIQDLETSFFNRKYASVMTTASSTRANTSSSRGTTGLAVESSPTSPCTIKFSKTLKPLLPNVNTSNQPHYQQSKTPPIVRQYSSPILHSNHTGPASTLMSPTNMNRLDLDGTSLTNLAPSVITPVQVRVKGFH